MWAACCPDEEKEDSEVTGAGAPFLQVGRSPLMRHQSTRTKPAVNWRDSDGKECGNAFDAKADGEIGGSPYKNVWRGRRHENERAMSAGLAGREFFDGHCLAI